MSDKVQDQFNDYIIDHGHELMEQWVETESGWKEFTKWLFSSEQNILRQSFFADFLIRESREYDKFLEWARARQEG